MTVTHGFFIQAGKRQALQKSPLRICPGQCDLGRGTADGHIFTNRS